MGDFYALNETMPFNLNLSNHVPVPWAGDMSSRMGVALHGADAKELEAQTFIKDPNKKVLEKVKEVIAKTGENIRIGRIFRVELGK